ncbi:TonB-dependent siderophore receptor [Methylobacillus sp. MM3]|uniref:TonB-dependent receptor plug domain-containing protein n=1 Tax=Methylobacillus sp. MM3 TaxID=1848039 RepID=UPI000AC8EBE2|nr:TonB-dependent receptor [Methylobacillus sp. MM3]
MKSSAHHFAGISLVTAARYLAGGMLLAPCLAFGITNEETVDLSHMSIDDLANIEISSVSKKKESLSAAAAAVFVITQEDIRRSGYTSVPEVLRLAPNLQVARIDASQYAITARGFNENTTNKLLVLIDGRTVYTPLFSGVFWDVQDVMLQDIERIEVISGPGGTLWGSNAVNGVINIITRSAHATQGTLLNAGVGTQEHGGAARHGGKLNDNTAFRVYAKGFERDGTERANGTDAHDRWHKQQAGFRLDSDDAGDKFTLQGDLYDGESDQRVGSDKTFSGVNLLGRWNHALGGDDSLQVQTYFDRTRRDYPGLFREQLDTYDLDIQHRFRWRQGHDIVWGGGYRVMEDSVENSASLAFLPTQRSLKLANLFGQDSIALADALKLTLGIKLEHNSYTGTETQPSARLAWKLDEKSLFWSSVSRAVRTPSRIDAEFFVPANAPFRLIGNEDFESEELIAYEVGYRADPTAKLSFSISAFYNDYDKLRSVELSPGGLPFVLGNKMRGNTYGVEMWGNYRVNDWWRLSAGYNYLKKDLELASDSSDTSSLDNSETDPRYQFSLRSSMNLPRNVELDLTLRSVGGLSSSEVPSYTELDARLGWMITKGVSLSVSGFNLLDREHPEFGSLPARSEFRRSVYMEVSWQF